MVTVTIIGFLIALGAINHTNQKEKVNTSSIRNDIMIVESVVKQYLVLDVTKFEFWGREDADMMNTYREEGVIYDRTGRVSKIFDIAIYNHIPDEFVKEETLIERTGHFFMNEEGVVYYVDDASIEVPPPVTE